MRVRRVFLFVLFFSCLLAFGQGEQQTSAPPNTPAPGTPAASDPSAAVPSTASPENGARAADAKTTSLPDLKPDANGALSQEQMQQLFRVVADKDAENDKRQRDYTYIDREVQNNLDGKGLVKSTEIKTYEVLEIYGEQVQRLIEKQDKALDSKEAAKEEEKIQKIIDKRKNESEEDRRKREAKQEKEREDGRKFVHEVADAYNFKLAGTELVGGREAWVIDGEPRPGFEPHMKESKFLSKFHGRVWIDKADLQLARMDVEAIETVSLGWVLARVHKGTRVMLEQTRVNEEVWLPRLVTFKIDARVALLKGYNVDGEQTYRDYKKFRTSTKILDIGEVKEQK
ncbi:MAG TPA: hypothetical protein VFE61_32020 [Candidatus Sulfotelmatobacter sp.]|jgi:hypothetical protein|nr:hypothetical protein [Candidatus Sulfotelmatobacter sp.]